MFVIELLSKFINYGKDEWAFGLSFVLIFSASAINAVLSITVKEFTFKKRLWYVVFCFGVCLAEFSGFLAENKGVFLPLLSVGVAVTGFTPCLIIPVKKRLEPEKELIKYIDDEIKRADVFSDRENVSSVKTEPQIKTQSATKLQTELDYSHVKNVIERLDYMSLNTGERKQVKDLEISLMRAERGETDKELKSEINEGLGALLKIMSKYGA